MNAKIFLSLLAIFFIVAPVSAKPSQAAEELSKTMLTSEQYKEMLEAIVQTGLSLAAQKAVEQDSKTPDLEREKKALEAKLRKAFSYEYFIDMNAKTMRKNFKEEELSKLLTFFKTDLGKKWVKHTPEIVKETMTQLQADLDQKLPGMVGIQTKAEK